MDTGGTSDVLQLETRWTRVDLGATVRLHSGSAAAETRSLTCHGSSTHLPERVVARWKHRGSRANAERPAEQVNAITTGRICATPAARDSSRPPPIAYISRP